MKRFTRILLALVLTFTLCMSIGCMIRPEQDADGFVLKFNLADGTYTVVDYVGTETEIKVPSTFNGKAVTTIAKGAFKEPTLAEKMTRHDYTEYDSNFAGGNFDKAFYNQIVSIEIPSSVKTIEEYAFANCAKLESVEITTSLTSIGNSAFSGCVFLENFTVAGGNGMNEWPKSIKKVSDGVFFNCAELKTMRISSSVEHIGKLAFSKCTSLESITIFDDAGNTFNFVGAPATVTGSQVQLQDKNLRVIDNYAFKDSFSKKDVKVSIEFPDSVASLGASAFENAQNLVGVYLSESITELKANTFYNCASLDEDAIDMANIEKIGEGVFRNCTTLSSVKLNDKIRDIPKNAFRGCTGLTEIDLSTAIENVQEGEKITIGDNAFSECSNVETFIFHEQTYSIGKNALSECIELRSVYVPSAVNKMSAGIFNNCNNLVVYYDAFTSPNIASAWLGTGPIEFSGVKVDDIYKHKNGDNVLAEYVLRKINNVDSYVLARYLDRTTRYENVSSLDYEMLSTIEKDGTTYNVVTINDSAFKNCKGLSSVKVSNTVTELGKNAFAFAQDLTSTVIPNTINTISEGAFSNCVSLVDPGLPTSIVNIQAKAFANCTQLGKGGITINLDSVTRLGDYVFSGCSSLEKVSLKGLGLTTAGYALNNYLFEGCSKISEITFDSTAKITAIGNGTFKDCSGLTDNEFIDWTNITSIGVSAFENCSGYTSFEIAASVQTIGDRAFKGCSKITEFKVDSANPYYLSADGILFSSPIESSAQKTFNVKAYITYEDGGTTKQVYFRRTGAAANGQKNVAFKYRQINQLMFYPLAKTDTTYTLNPDQIAQQARDIYLSEIFAYAAGDAYFTRAETELAGKEYKFCLVVDGTTYTVDNYDVDNANTTDLAILNTVVNSDKIVPVAINTIKAYAFEGATNLTKVTFGANISVGDGAFDGCSALADIEITSSTETSIVSNVDGDGVLYEMDTKTGVIATLAKFPEAKTVESYTIPDTVTKIKAGAFSNSSRIGTLYIGKNVEEFGSNTITNALANANIGKFAINYDYVKLLHRYVDGEDATILAGTLILPHGEEVTLEQAREALKVAYKGNQEMQKYIDTLVLGETKADINEFRIEHCVGKTNLYHVDEQGVLYTVTSDTTYNQNTGERNEWKIIYKTIEFMPADVDFTQSYLVVPEGVSVQAYALSGNDTIKTIVLTSDKAKLIENALVNSSVTRIAYHSDYETFYGSTENADNRSTIVKGGFEDKVYFYAYDDELVAGLEGNVWTYATAVNVEGYSYKYNEIYDPTYASQNVNQIAGTIKVKNDKGEIVDQAFNFKIATKVVYEDSQPKFEEARTAEDQEYGTYVPVYDFNGNALKQIIFTDTVSGVQFEDPYYDTQK